MKKFTIKKASLAVSLILLFSLLASCAPAATATQPPAPTQAPPAAQPAAPTQAPAPTVAPTQAQAESPTSAPSTSTGKKFKVAIVFPGSIKDAGWNQSGYESIMAAKDKYGIDVSFQESVQQADVKDVLSNYASEGYDLVIGDDLYFTDPVNEVAPNFPNVMFGISGGSASKAPNVVAVTATNWESTYLAGALAGLVTKSNKIGILTATDSPVAKRMVNGFKAGALSQNPNIQTVHAFVGNWNDVVKGKELVGSMIKQGADVIYSQCGQVNQGAVEAAKAGGALAIGAVVDMWNVAPDTVVSSAIQSPGAYVDYLVKMLEDGTLKDNGGKSVVLGVKSGVEDLAPYHNFDSKLSQDIKDKVAQVRQDLIDGKIPTPPSQ